MPLSLIIITHTFQPDYFVFPSYQFNLKICFPINIIMCSVFHLTAFPSCLVFVNYLPFQRLTESALIPFTSNQRQEGLHCCVAKVFLHPPRFLPKVPETRSDLSLVIVSRWKSKLKSRRGPRDEIEFKDFFIIFPFNATSHSYELMSQQLFLLLACLTRILHLVNYRHLSFPHNCDLILVFLFQY